MSDAIGSIAENIEALRSLDRGLAIFGASTHRYRLRPTLSEAGLQALEAEHGLRLPDGLRRFLAEVGDGRCGPAYGLIRVAGPDGSLVRAGARLAQDFPGCDAINARSRAAAEAEDPDTPVEDDEFDVPDGFVHGCIDIGSIGCGHRNVLVVRGEQAGLVLFHGSDGPLTSTGKTFVEWYDAWLTDSLARLRFVLERMRAGNSAAEIHAACVERQEWDGFAMIRSLAGEKAGKGDRGTRSDQERLTQQILTRWRAR